MQIRKASEEGLGRGRKKSDKSTLLQSSFTINNNNNNNNNNNIHLYTAHITWFHGGLQFCKGEIGRQHIEQNGRVGGFLLFTY